MQRLLNAKWFLFLKWIVATGSIFYVAYHITSRAENISIENIRSTLNQNNSKTESLFLLVILMVLNWTIESLKWKILIEEAEKINFLKSLRAVLTGITVSLYSPNRSGEFLGRVMHLQPKHRVEGSLLTFIGSICQLTVTIQAGLFAFVLYSFGGTSNFKLQAFNFFILIISFILLMHVPKWMGTMKYFKFFAKYAERLTVLQKFSKPKLLLVYLLSAMRYLVFAFQFYMLLRICGIDLAFTNMFTNIALSFMLTSIIPSVALGELGVRGSVNLNLFSLNHENDTAILVASFLLWLINLAIPAIIGALCSFYIRWNNSSEK